MRKRSFARPAALAALGCVLTLVTAGCTKPGEAAPSAAPAAAAQGAEAPKKLTAPPPNPDPATQYRR